MSGVVLQDRAVKVREIHPCSWCNELIEVGEKVHYRAYVWDEGIASEWMHPECYEAMKRVPYEDIEEGYEPGWYSRGGTECHG